MKSNHRDRPLDLGHLSSGAAQWSFHFRFATTKNRVDAEQMHKFKAFSIIDRVSRTEEREEADVFLVMIMAAGTYVKTSVTVVESTAWGVECAASALHSHVQERLGEGVADLPGPLGLQAVRVVVQISLPNRCLTSLPFRLQLEQLLLCQHPASPQLAVQYGVHHALVFPANARLDLYHVHAVNLFTSMYLHVP